MTVTSSSEKYLPVKVTFSSVHKPAHEHDHFVGSAGARPMIDADSLQVFGLFAAETDGQETICLGKENPESQVL